MESVEVCVSWLGHHVAKIRLELSLDLCILDDMIENKF